MTSVKIVIPFISNDELILLGIYNNYEISQAYEIIKESVVYRPVALSSEEANRLYFHRTSSNLEQIKVTDINGNSFLVRLHSISYLSELRAQ